MIEVRIISEKQIEIQSEVNAAPQFLYELINQPYRIQLWFADTVEKTPKGFNFQIKLPLHTIESDVSIVSNGDLELQFLWKSEYIMSPSLVIWKILAEPTRIIITEIGDFNLSYWKRAQEIHIELWKETINRLIRYVYSVR